MSVRVVWFEIEVEEGDGQSKRLIEPAREIAARTRALPAPKSPRPKSPRSRQERPS